MAKKTLTTDQLLAKYKIGVPEGTSEELKKLFIQKHEEALAFQDKATTAEKLAAAEQKKLEDAKTLLAKQEEQLKERESALEETARGYGEFKVGDKTFVITCPMVRRINAQSKDMEIITYQKLLSDKALQKEFADPDFRCGMVAEKDKWVPARQKLVDLTKANKNIEKRTPVKVQL